MVTIYAFTCTQNGKAYIGCTRGNVGKRFREHRHNLRHGRHTEQDLLEDWKTYGETAFDMVTLFQLEDHADLHALRGMEKFAMRRYKERGLLYNRNESSFEPIRAAQMKGIPLATMTEGRKRSPEANEKRRLAQLGIPKNHGHKISATKQAQKLMR